MKIAIDISPLKTGHGVRGTGSYTKSLIEALQKYETGHSYHFFTRGQSVPKNVDAVHYPYFDPFFITLPIDKPKPVIVTVHDLIPIAYPNHFPRGVRGEIRWQIQRWSLTRAGAVITDSNASKNDIMSFVPISKDKISVIYLAPSDSFRPITDTSKLQKVRNIYHLPTKFILYVGDVNWNKNLPGLIRAFHTLGKKELTLVLVGRAFVDSELNEVKNLNKLISEYGLKGHVIKPGFVFDHDLVGLYNLATVYVQPSFAEGFGLPVLEAMACGCPVVSSETTSLSEIAGPSVLVDPNSTQEIVAGIKKGLSMNRQTWVAKATRWVEKFNWKRTAAETVSVYKRMVGS